jgi:hypothetical protein
MMESVRKEKNEEKVTWTDLRQLTLEYANLVEE